jgi:sigma-B regulation protein RsbU (phosphoserine phosphatase)
MIAAPLAFRDRFFGVLAVANPANGRPFTATDFELVKSLAEQAALALHNAEFLHLQIERRQLDLDLSLASGIQQMLLPQAVPQMAGLDIDARYLPAQKVGGDLYDLIPLSDCTLGLAVADVSGKGIPASLLMAICRSNLRQIAPRFGSPAQVLVELNRALMGDIHPDMFITLIYAVVDTRAGTVTFARAGHELPLLGHRDAASGGYASEFLGSEGMPVGLVPNEIFAGAIIDRVAPFQGGDTLVLYTDGITEAPNDEGKEFSGARLADTIRVLHNRSARELNDGILETVSRFVGGTPQRDDYTLVTVKRIAG